MKLLHSLAPDTRHRTPDIQHPTPDTRHPTSYLIALFCLLSSVFCLSSCSFTKSLFKSKQSSHTTESNEASATTRTQINQDWTQMGSTLQHRDGLLAIRFDGHTDIDITPTGQIKASGTNPTIISSSSITTKDTTFTSAATSQLTEKDSTGASQKEALEESEVKDLHKETETQSLAPILIVIAIILVLVLLGKFFKII